MNYRETIDYERTTKIRAMLKELPPACGDFINSIALTTQPLTRMAYVIDFKTFCDFVDKELPAFADKNRLTWTDADWMLLKAKDLQRYSEYLAYYFQDHLDPETEELQQTILQNHECGIMRKLSSLRSFFDYMYKNERIDGNIASLVNLPVLHEKPILFLIGPEIEKLLSVAEDGEGLTERQKKYQQYTRLRDKAILMLFLGTGMRISECVGIDLEDLDFTINGVLVTRKGGDQAILFYPDDVAEALKEYLKQRKEIETADEDRQALFLSMQRKRISQRAVQLMVKKYCAVAAPLKKKMSPHKLRSTYATRLYQQTGDIYLVADALGHSDINTTRKHYASASEENRRAASLAIKLPTSSESPANVDKSTEMQDHRIDLQK